MVVPSVVVALWHLSQVMLLWAAWLLAFGAPLA
jgi:hypothetical protein